MGESDKACFVSEGPGSVQLYSNYSDVWYTNGFNKSNYVKSKKLTFGIEIANHVENTIKIHIGAQKHMWYGWKRDNHREFYYTPSLSNVVYQAVANNHLVTVPVAERYCHKGGKLDVIIGRKNISNKPVGGSVLVWSDCIAEKDAKGNFLWEKKKILDGNAPGGLRTVNVPKCLESKAFHVRVSL